jgi:hypothetical protein
MPTSAARHKRRLVLIEVSPSWNERLGLWLLKLRNPRHGWFGLRWFSRVRKSDSAARPSVRN